ncbi:MAG: serine/threonine protein kinase [Actinomycetia bacterium]|nr:serine/threonine protein kinase [Actinomycetes bacterium]
MRILAGRYELERELGSGGMGAVYQATDLELGRSVAVKVLPEQLARQPGFLARFQREARVAAGLSHPHLVVVHDVGQEKAAEHAVPYLVMELVQGRTLAEVLRGGPLAPERAASVVLDVLEALEHCHAKGVVHRDIKPANIMLDESGPRPVVKVMDFGIARLLSEEATRLTSTGMLIGTPAYLSPEQADGKLVLPASDLYSLGCVLYELLTGRPPFAGETPSGVLMGHLLRTPQAPSALRPGLSAQWDQAVLTALAKDPQDRYTNAADMRAALLNALEPTAASVAAARDRLAVPAQRVPPGGELPRTLPSPAGTVSVGLPATLARWVEGLSRAAAALAFVGYVLYISAPVEYQWSHAAWFNLFFLMMVVCSAATLNQRTRLPAAAGVFGTTPGWAYLAMMELTTGDRGIRLAISFLCFLAMSVTAGAVALGGGLTMSPTRFAVGLLAPLAIIGLPMTLWGLPPGRLAVIVTVACVLYVLVLLLAASFRSRRAAASAVAGGLIFMLVLVLR